MLHSRVSLFALMGLVLAAPLARAQTGGEAQAGVTSADIAAGMRTSGAGTRRSRSRQRNTAELTGRKT